MIRKTMYQASRRCSMRGEQLEQRQMLTVTMSDYEQLLLELINRARENPVAEVARNPFVDDLNDGVDPDVYPYSISGIPKQPLAPVQTMIDSAVGHAQDMLDRDFVDTVNPDGLSPRDRLAAAGGRGSASEILGSTMSAESLDLDSETRRIHDQLFADAKTRTHHILGEGTLSRIGIGIRMGVITGEQDSHAARVAVDFGTRQRNHHITGVVYHDGQTLEDDFYSVGEGIENVEIRAVGLDGRSFTTTTGPSGGYALEVPWGTYEVTAVGLDMTDDVMVSSRNVKVDFETSGLEPLATPILGQDLLGLNANSQLWVGRTQGVTLDMDRFATWPSAPEFTHFGVGDLDGDGLDDVVGRQANGRLRVATNNDGNSFSIDTWGTYPNYVEWTDFHVADFTGDGKADVLARATSNGNWWLGRSTGTAFVMTKWGNFTEGVPWDMRFGDFNGDGVEDVAGRAQTNGAVWVGISSANRFTNSRWARWSTNDSWSDFRVGDFDGDGMDDIAGRANNKDWWIGSSTGTSFASKRWGSWTAAATWEDVVVGDFDGDDDDDIAGRANGKWWIALADQQSKTFENQLWGSWANTLETIWSDIQVIDINGDGKDDLMGRHSRPCCGTPKSNWWSLRSSGTAFVNQRATTWDPYMSWQYVAVGNFGGPPDDA